MHVEVKTGNRHVVRGNESEAHREPALISCDFPIIFRTRILRAHFAVKEVPLVLRLRLCFCLERRSEAEERRCCFQSENHNKNYALGSFRERRVNGGIFG